jgi:parallel beta-helix repeat protein
MKRMRNCWAGQHRALTIQGATRGVLGRLGWLGIAVICGIAFASVSALANDAIVVPRDFPTIQAAVNAAAPGTTIRVRRGTYTEQIVIAKDLTLKGEGMGKTIIKSPSTLTPFALNTLNNIPVATIVQITDGAHVRLSEVTVTGPTPCGLGVRGISVVKASTLKLSDSRVTLIRPEDLTCPIEFLSTGVTIGLPQFFEIDGEEGSTGHGTVAHVQIDRFLSTGIAVLGPFEGPPSTATISDNVITGGTPFTTLGQNGISVSFAAVARVTGNTVRGTVCTDPACGRDPINESQSSGIGTNSNPPGTVIEENTVSGNDVGIYLFGSEGCCQTRENTVRNNRFFGILIQDGKNNTEENDISGGEVGVGVVADFTDTVAVLHGDEIKRTSVLPVQEISCCGFTATAIIEDD